MGGKIDALIYGCTHYPLLREVVEDVMQEEFRPCGGQLQYIDPAKVVAEHIESKVDARRVTNGGLTRDEEPAGSVRFCVNAFPEDFQERAARILNYIPDVEEICLDLPEQSDVAVPAVGIVAAS